MGDFMRLELHRNGSVVYSTVGTEQSIKIMAEVFEMTGAKAVLSVVDNPLPDVLKETCQ